MLLVFFLGVGSKSYAQFLINESFRGKTTDTKNKIVTGGNPYSAFLTASGTNGDTDGEGWIRLNSDGTNQKGFFYVDQSFPSNKGVFVDFEYKTWRSKKEGSSGYTDGDGIGVFLFDGSTTKFELGGYGGSLGYAPMSTTQGLNGGYIGLGIDEYGNYSSTVDGKEGKSGKEREFQHRLALRGKTDRKEANNKSNLLLYSEALNATTHGADKVGYTTVTITRPTDGVFYRRVQIEINPLVENKKIVGSKVIVRWAVKKGGEFYKVMEKDYKEVPPANLKIGFAASTGGAINFHEVRDLFATTPGGVKIEKTADKSLVNVGDDLTYTVTLKGQNAKDLTFKINDDLNAIKDFFKVESITFVNNNNGSTTKLATGALTLQDVEVTLKQLGTVSFVIKGKVLKAQSNGMLTNTATINKSTLPAEVQDLVTADQLTSTTITQVVDPNFCGCPTGAINLQSSGVLQTLKAGNVYCVNGEIFINGGLTIEEGAALYVQSGAKLKVKGFFTQIGGVVSVCPKGGIEIEGSVLIGYGGVGDSRIILKDNAYFTVTGSFTQYEPSNGKVSIELNDTSVVEICATYDQHAKTYPVVKYTGTGLHNAYFIVKAEASSGGGTLTNSDNVNVIAMNKVSNLNIGSKNYCGPNATESNCKIWPSGLTDQVVGVKCGQAEGITDRTEPVGPDFCDYPGDKFISGYHSTIIKTATGFQIFGEQTKPIGGTYDHFLVPTDITFANGFNYEGSPLMATIGSQYYANNQNFLLTTKGLYVWGTRGSSTKYAVIHPDLVTSNAFQRIDLPVGVTPKDVKYMTASNNVLAILLNNGQIKISGTKATLYGDGTSIINKDWHTVSTAGNTPLLNVEMMKMHATGGIAYTKDGKYFAWGTTVFDGTKRVDNANYSYAQTVKTPFSTKPVMLGVTGISEDKFISYFALSEDGKIYSVGSNSKGQLGIGITTESLSWQVVKKEDGTELTDIKYLSAQDNSSYEAAAAAINKYGRVYFWGANGYAMLGQPDGVGSILYATEPQGLNDNRVVYVEVGGHTGMIVNDQNKYCYVGHKIYGSMGDGIAAESLVDTFDCKNTPNVINMCGKIEIVPEPSLMIEKTGVYSDANKDGKVNVGDVINYKFKVTNTGNTGLKNITITDDKITVKGGPINLAQNGLDTDTFTGTYIITQKDVERGGVLNIATGNGEGEKGGKVTTTTIDPNPNKPKPTDPNYPIDSRYPEDNDKYKNCLDCTVTLLEQQPSITLVKVGVVDEDAVTAAGNGVINYTFTITNTGNVSLTLKDFKDSKITGFTPVFKQGEGTGSLEVGKTWTATATYTITDADVDAEKVENRAEVTGTAPKGKTTKAESKDEKGFDKPTITPVEGGGPLITNPHIYHKVQ